MSNRVFLYTFIMSIIFWGGWSAYKLKMDTDVKGYNLAAQQDIMSYEAFVQSLEKDKREYSIIILEKQTGWNTLEDFKLLKAITAFWEEQPQIVEASSIVTINYPRKGLMFSRAEPFLNLNHKEQLEKRLKDYELYYDVFQKFLSADRKYTLVFLETAQGIPAQSAKNFAARHYETQGVEVHYLQYDLIEKELQAYLRKDTLILGLLSLLFILAGFYFFTHSLKGLGLISLLVTFNVAATFIVMSLLGIGFTLHMITVPCLITVLSFTDIMHILYHQKSLRKQCATDEILRKSIVSAVKIPLLLTSLTNIIGFIIFMILSDNIHLFNYALVSILGVVIAYLSSRYIVIQLMRKEEVYLRRKHFQQFYKVHGFIFQQLSQRRSWVFFFFMLANAVVILFVVLGFKIDHPDKDFAISDASISQGKEILEGAFFGNKQAEVFITSGNGMLWDETVLKKIETIEQRIDEYFSPLYINSPALIVKRYHRYASNGQPRAFYIPRFLGGDYKAALAKYKDRLGGAGIIADEADKARIVFGFADVGLPQVRAQYEQLQQTLLAESGPAVQFSLTGPQYLSDNATYHFSNKILIGFGVSVLFSSIVVFVLLRSARISLLLVLVNLLPIFSALGLIILLGISITPLTLFLMSILLGVCIDDSIYIVTQKRIQAERIHILPVFITSLVLILGFMALSFSSFAWLQPFGWVFLAGIALAYFLDVFILALWLNQEGGFELATNG
jgi:predicted RND superfamily exporter protein